MAFALEREQKHEKSATTRSQAIERRTRFLRIVLRRNNNGWSAQRLTGVRAKLVTARQFRRTLLMIESHSDLTAQEKINMKALAILTYRFGLRVSEASSLMLCHINVLRNRVEVRSTTRNRLKTMRSARILSMLDFIPEEEKVILQDCIDFATANYQIELFENTPYIKNMLRDSLVCKFLLPPVIGSGYPIRARVFRIT
jgi:integrase